MEHARWPGPTKENLPTVFKTRVFDLIDRASQNREVLSQALSELKQGKSLLEVGISAGTIEGDEDRRRHLDAHWLGNQHERSVLSRALIRAGDLALEHRMPIDIYWVFAARRFEVAVSWNRQQVTVLVIRPFPNIPTHGEAPDHPQIEIFR
jgi:hypothetical protein